MYFSFYIHSITVLHLPPLLQHQLLQYHTQANLLPRWKPGMQKGKREKLISMFLHIPSVKGAVKIVVNLYYVLYCRNNPLFLMSSYVSHWDTRIFSSLFSILGKKKKRTEDQLLQEASPKCPRPYFTCPSTVPLNSWVCLLDSLLHLSLLFFSSSLLGVGRHFTFLTTLEFDVVRKSICPYGVKGLI